MSCTKIPVDPIAEILPGERKGRDPKTEEGGSFFSNEDRRESFFSEGGSWFSPNLSREPKVNPADLPLHGPSLPKFTSS